MMNFMHFLCLHLLVSLLYTTGGFSNEEEPSTYSGSAVSLVIIGANGDLAKNKIWPALQELYLTRAVDLSELYVYAATREPVDMSTGSFRAFFSNLKCQTVSGKVWTQEECDAVNKELIRSVQVTQLKSESDYMELNDQITSCITSDQRMESSRIFYLAVPPFAYSDIAKNIHKHCSIAETRVAIEKPFGSNLESARNLANEIREYLSDDQIYLVDHYLHKIGVQQIADFRRINEDMLAPVWNTGGISRVEIVVQEANSVRGRTGYYDHYGVIRDMLQSHLTEVLALVTADLKGANFRNPESVNWAKYDVLSKVYSPFKESAYIGQYSGYQDHVCEASLDCTNHSVTPTLASVVLYIKDNRWASVPFILMSGKMTQKREGYVRVVFKKPTKFKPRLLDKGSELCLGEIIFSLHDEKGELCHTFVPPNAGYQSPFPGGGVSWVEVNSCNCYVQKFTPRKDATVLHPYASVIKGVIKGQRDKFVSLRNVLESWRVWSPLLHELEREKGQNLWLYMEDAWRFLSLSVSGTKIHLPSSPIEAMAQTDVHMPTKFATNVSDSTQYRNSSLLAFGFSGKLSGHKTEVLSWSSLVLSAARDIYNAALDSVSKRGVFHLALPGGSSPVGVYQALVLNYRHIFPWGNTHIWQTDERCLPPTSLDSNLYRISVDLLNFIPIPMTNIHPLLDTMLTPCIGGGGPGAAGAILDDYWTKLVDGTGLDRFDYVLLGVGGDGHVASLFPSDALQYQEIGVNLTAAWITADYPVYVKHRVSVTLETIASACHIGLLVVGDKKCSIIKKEDSKSAFYRLLNLARENSLKLFMDDVCIT